MRVLADMHTHTIFSHGTGTVRDNVEAALQRGLRQVAISDHGPGHSMFGVRDIEKYLRAIEDAKREYAGRIEVFSNLELNLLSPDGELDMPRGYEKCFDLLMFGFHKMARFSGISDRLYFLFCKNREKNIERNTNAYIAAIERYPVFAVTHPGYGILIDKRAVARAAAARGTRMEINAKHPEFGRDELAECRKMGVNFIISSDAHAPGKVGCVASAVQKAMDAGLDAAEIYMAEQGGIIT